MEVCSRRASEVRPILVYYSLLESLSVAMYKQVGTYLDCHNHKMHYVMGKARSAGR